MNRTESKNNFGRMLFTVFIPLHRIGIMVCNYYSILPELVLTDFL